MAFQAIVGGALAELTRHTNYEQVGTLTPEETAEYMAAMMQGYYDDACGGDAGIPTPFWDEVTDTDDTLPVDEQTWYGEVTNPTAPADQLTFQENAAIWLITAFIAYSGQIGGAILFPTIAKRWILAFKKGDVREIFRVIVDAAEVGTIDTDDYAAGDLIEMVVVPDPAVAVHDVMIVRTL